MTTLGSRIRCVLLILVGDRLPRCHGRRCACEAPSRLRDEAFAVRSWATLTPDAVSREWPLAVNGWRAVVCDGRLDGEAISADVGRLTRSAPGRRGRRCPSWRAARWARVLGGQVYGALATPSPARLEQPSACTIPPPTFRGATTPFPVAAGCGGSGVIAGTLYALTGCEVQYWSYTGSLFSFNTATHQWTPRATNPVLRQYPAVAAAGGKLYAVGGILPDGRASGDVTMYTPATNSWQAKASIPVPRYGAVAIPYGPKLVVFGGVDASGNALDDTWLYDPATNTWVKVPTTGLVARGNLAGSVVAGAAYAVGGLQAISGSGALTNALQRIFP
ncbi:MAG: kelch repeat-containing protein [Gemmatimonadaceae bacterium]